MYYTRRNKRKKHYRKTIRRGGQYNREDYLNDTDAIRQFREDFSVMISNTSVNARMIIDFFDNTPNQYLETRRHYLINTLIPVKTENNMYIPEFDKDAAQDYVPVMCLVIQRVSGIKDIISIVRTYKQKGGKLDLDSSVELVSVIDTAFEMKNFTLVNYLMTIPSVYVPYYITEYYKENELDPTYPPLLPPVPNIKEDYVLEPPAPPAPTVTRGKRKTPKKTPSETLDMNIKEPELGMKPLQLDSPLTKYSTEEEPAFWLSVFKPGELSDLRKGITDLIRNDLKIGSEPGTKQMSEMWSICKIVRDIIPKFNVPQEIPQPYTNETDLFVVPSVKDFAEYNIILCSTFLIYGILSYKLRKEDYRIVVKGGKGVQLALSKLAGIPPDFKYESEDIDLLILSKDGVEHNASRAETLASHIAYLVEWLLSVVFTNKISVLLPSESPRNKTIVKLSYVTNGFKQFSDISFEALSERVKPFFEDHIRIDRSTPFGKVKYISQSIDNIISEKMFFISEYSKLLKNPKISKHEKSEYERAINKFKRTIREIERATDTVKKQQLSR